jgi:Zn-dependent protease with chaperone function
MGPDDWGRHLNLVNHLEGTSGDSGFFFAPFSTHPSHRQRVQALRRLRKHSEVAAPPVPPL